MYWYYIGVELFFVRALAGVMMKGQGITLLMSEVSRPSAWHRSWILEIGREDAPKHVQFRAGEF